LARPSLTFFRKTNPRTTKTAKRRRRETARTRLYWNFMVIL